MLPEEFSKNLSRPTPEATFATSYPLARLSFLAYAALIVYASLTPFNFQTIHLNPFSWMTAPTPRYIPFFDVEVNILGYFPLGFLGVLAFYPRKVRLQAFFLACLTGIILSCLLETLQIYLPSRVANTTDLYANALGTLIGALFASFLRPTWLTGNFALGLRYKTFGHYRGFFLLITLFPIAQIFPQNVWLGMGDFNITGLRISPFWTSMLTNATQEALIAMIAVISTSAFIMFGTYRKSPQLKMMLTILCLGVGLKIAMSQLQYGSYGFTYWTSTANLMGILAGLILSLLLRGRTKITQWNMAFFGFILLIILSNLLPQNPYHLSQLQLLPQGRLTHFNGLLEWLSMVWPLGALIVLMKDRAIDLEAPQAASMLTTKQI